MEETAKQSHDVPTVLYIAGYGRSGSTVLDVLLGSADQAVSVGELVYLGEEWQHNDRTCACGTVYEHCPFWKDVFSTPEEANKWKRLARRVESRGRLLHLLSGSIPERDRLAYRNETRSLFSYIAERGNASIVVDSSKSARHAAGRFWALRNIAGLDVRVLHLVRDARSTLRSVVQKGDNWVLEGRDRDTTWLPERTVLGWGFANAITALLGAMMADDRYLCVRFEDLLQSPDTVLNEIGMLVDVDLDSVRRAVRENRSFPIGHNVGGNRIRHQETVTLQTSQTPFFDEWGDSSVYHQSLFFLFNCLLNRAFGYR